MSTPTEPNWKHVKTLLKRNRPHVRRFDLERDLWLLWATYDLGGFEFLERKLSKEKFVDEILKYIGTWTSVWLIDDECKWFERKRGPTAIVGVLADGWKLEPHFEFFKWATPRQILRAMVAFLNMAAKDKGVGVCIGRAPATHTRLLDHIKRRYRLWWFVGKIPNGGPYGDEYLYSLRGSRELVKET